LFRLSFHSGPLSLLIACIAVVHTNAHARQPVADDTRPMTPGVHWLTFDHTFKERTQATPYGLYVPPNVKQAINSNQKLPLVVTLCGRGGLGMEYKQVYAESAIGLLKRNAAFAKSVNYFLLRPMSRPEVGWENERVADYIVQAVKRIAEHYPVDLNRVHIIGMSLGGEGVWHAAEAGPGVFASIVALSGRQHDDPDAIAQAVKGSTVVITVASNDGEFTSGSRKMADAIRKAGGSDLTYIEISDRGHGLFYHYLYRPEMYDWMVLHRRGSPPPAKRADEHVLRSWGRTPPGNPHYNRWARQLQFNFQQFRKYWFIESCAMVDGVGPRDRSLGKAKTFVTQPFSVHMPCRIMHTTTLHKIRTSTLHLELAHPSQGEARLVVKINGHNELSAKMTAEGDEDDSPWRHYRIDLTDYAGQEVFIQILHRQPDPDRPATQLHWARIELTTKR
jgi:dienelactone hydrolase